MTTQIESLTVFCVEDRKGDKDFWTRIGKAWPHKNGKGFSITLNALPLNGRLVAIDDEEQDGEDA